MGKRVKKNNLKKDLDFAIFLHINDGSFPAQIARAMKISKQRVQYYTASLDERGLIKKDGQGAWKTIKNYVPKRSKKSTQVATLTTHKSFDSFKGFKPNSIRGHAYMFKFRLPVMRRWSNDDRELLLSKRGFSFDKLRIVGGGQGFHFRKRRVWITNKSVIVYTAEGESYFGENPEYAHAVAVKRILYLIKALERILGRKFSQNGRYELKTCRQHHSLIKNALANIYNRKKEPLKVYDEKGLWLLIDDSFNLGELEAVHPKTSIPDAKGMQKVMNTLKKNNFELPTEESIQKEISKKQMGITQILDQLSNNVIKLTGEVIKLKEEKNDK